MNAPVAFLALAGLALVLARPWRPYTAIRGGEGVARQFASRYAAVRWAERSERWIVIRGCPDDLLAEIVRAWES